MRSPVYFSTPLPYVHPPDIPLLLFEVAEWEPLVEGPAARGVLNEGVAAVRAELSVLFSALRCDC